MVLGKLPVPGHPIISITVGQGPTALAVGAGRGCLDMFTLIYPISFLSPSLWETTRYRLKYCLKGSLSPKTTKSVNHNKSIFNWFTSQMHFICRFKFNYNLTYLFSNCFVNNYKEIGLSDKNGSFPRFWLAKADKPSSLLYIKIN